MTVKLFRQPCQRLDLTEVVPFRTGNARMGQIESILPKVDWAVENPLIRTALITYFFNDADVALLPKFKLPCRRFLQTENDVLAEQYEGPDGTLSYIHRRLSHA